MDIVELTSLIQGVGFPIACAVALFYLLYQEMKQRQTDAEARAKRDAEFSRIIAENTAATNSLRELVQHLHGNEDSHA